MYGNYTRIDILDYAYHGATCMGPALNDDKSEINTTTQKDIIMLYI